MHLFFGAQPTVSPIGVGTIIAFGGKAAEDAAAAVRGHTKGRGEGGGHSVGAHLAASQANAVSSARKTVLGQGRGGRWAAKNSARPAPWRVAVCVVDAAARRSCRQCSEEP